MVFLIPPKIVSHILFEFVTFKDIDFFAKAEDEAANFR